ncbi:hypothetical protein [Methylobacterium sp. JK268]
MTDETHPIHADHLLRQADTIHAQIETLLGEDAANSAATRATLQAVSQRLQDVIDILTKATEDPERERAKQLALGRRVMAKHHDVLRKLAR